MKKKIKIWFITAATMMCTVLGSAFPVFAQVDPNWEEGTVVEETVEPAGESETPEQEPVAESETPEQGPIAEESSQTETAPEEEAALSTPGNGQLGDVITSGNKDFYTIHTKNNNTFYLVIDHSGSADNVYMLSMIDENDLSEFLTDKEEEASSQVVVVPEEQPEKESEVVEEEETETKEIESKPQENGSGGMLTLILLAVLGVGAAGYYFKVYKPKKEAQHQELEGMETDDGLETEREDDEE